MFVFIFLFFLSPSLSLCLLSLVLAHWFFSASFFVDNSLARLVVFDLCGYNRMASFCRQISYNVPVKTIFREWFVEWCERLHVLCIYWLCERIICNNQFDEMATLRCPAYVIPVTDRIRIDCLTPIHKLFDSFATNNHINCTEHSFLWWKIKIAEYNWIWTKLWWLLIMTP